MVWAEGCSSLTLNISRGGPELDNTFKGLHYLCPSLWARVRTAMGQGLERERKKKVYGYIATEHGA